MEGFENVNEVVDEEGVNDSTAAEVETEGTEVPEDTSVAEEKNNVQSAEDNARYAAARRRAEAEFASRQRAQDMEFERRFKGYENPITHAPIRSQRDYLEALDAQEMLQRNQELQSKGIDPRMFEEAVSRQVANNPTLLQAQAIIDDNRRNVIANKMSDDLKEIQKLSPEIKDIDEVLRMSNSDYMLSLVSRGMSLAEAYKVANLDTLIAQNTASVKQRTINNIKGTQHLNATDGVSNSSDNYVDIPQSELAQWKRAFPDATMKQLKEKYNKSL